MLCHHGDLLQWFLYFFVQAAQGSVSVVAVSSAAGAAPRDDLYLHPVCSKQSNPPDAAHAGLYTHVFSMLIGFPLAPYVIGHGAGSVLLRLSHGLEGFAPCKCPALALEVPEAPPDAGFR